MSDLNGSEGEGEDGDVVFLAEGLCGVGDGFSGLGADGGGAVEAEEFPGGEVRWLRERRRSGR